MIEMRKGKTKRDAASGSASRNAANKARRAAWENGTPSEHTNDKFPSETCNGKRYSNRAR